MIILKDTFALQILYLYKDFIAYVNEELKAYQINRGQIPFILYIGKHESCTPSEVTKNLKMDWGHSQRSINKLVEQNLIVKIYEKENGRRYHLYLTERGKEFFQLCHDLFHNWDLECLSSMSENDQQKLVSCLKKLTNSIEGSKRECMKKF